MHPHKHHRLVPLLVSATACHLASAQTTPDTVQQLEQVTVQEVPIEQNIMPTSRPFNSVYGSDRSILDTPRNVTIISREQLSAINIQSVRDFSKLTSSSFTTTNFGAPANPTIRGQFADLFINGMRRMVTSNGNGLPVNFNSVESANIVKGPATVVYGPSFYVGGYTDFITKRPYFDKFRGSVSATLGSFDQHRWTADVGGPISEKVAYRVSYSGEDSEGYYDNSKKKTQALYAAITYRPSESYELFFNSEYYSANYTENFGINRVTQDLIDNGRYITGVNNNPAPVGGVYFDAQGNPMGFANGGVPAGAAAALSDPQNSRWVVSGFPLTNRIMPTGTVDIDRKLRLLRPGDDSNGKMWNGQVIQTFKVSPTFTVVNNSYAAFIERDTFSSYHYSEIVDPSWSLENRTEFRFDGDAHDINTGVSVRYQKTKAYNHFFFEPASVWDLTKDLNYVNVYNSVNWPDASEVPGWPGRYATPGVFNGDTNESSAVQIAPFYQHDWKLSESVSLLGGGRVDYVSVSAKDPLKPVFIPSADDDLSLGLPNANVSVTWKPLQHLTTYATYNYSQNYSGAVANGGGFGQLIDDGTGNYVLNGNAFRQESQLWEAGAKTSLMNGTLFAGAAVFKQDRTARQQDGSMREFEYTGLEFEANWQPSKNFFLTLSYSYLNAVSDLPQFDVGNVAIYDGTGDPANPSNYVPWPGNTRFFMVDNGPGSYRIQGLPRNLFNFLAQYRFDNGFGFSLNGWVHDEINNNVAGTLVIPWQYQLDASAFYETKRWAVKLAAINITDEENWSPPNYVYGNESIQAEWPISFELTATLKF